VSQSATAHDLFDVLNECFARGDFRDCSLINAPWNSSAPTIPPANRLWRKRRDREYIAEFAQAAGIATRSVSPGS
jgi:hypothetical protein